MARHIHADLIHAWAEGAEIEILLGEKTWTAVAGILWLPENKYRIKPTTKPDKVCNFLVANNGLATFATDGNIRCTFSGETGELIKAEVLK